MPGKRFIRFIMNIQKYTKKMEALKPKSIKEIMDSQKSSFEERILKAGEVLSVSESCNYSHNDLNKDFLQFLLELKKERIYLNSLLRQNLAVNGSIRKNDYDRLMGEIFTFLNEKEREIVYLFSRYSEDQMQTFPFFSQSSLEFANTDPDDNKEKISTLKSQMHILFKTQEDSKEHTLTKLAEFTQIHQRFTKKFKQLLVQDAQIVYKDIKNLRGQLLEEMSWFKIF
jgi:hypothetical protein